MMSNTEELQAHIDRLTAELAQAQRLSSPVAQALSDSRERYRRLADIIDDGFCIIQLKFDEHDQAVDYKFIETNRAFEIHTGLHNAEGKWVGDLIPDHDRYWFETYGKVARSGQAIRYENRANALQRWFEVHATPISGSAELVAVVFKDTSAQRNAEKALRESEEYWRGVFEKLEDGFVSGELIRDASGAVTDWKYLDVNPAWGLTVGIEPQFAKNKTIRQLFPTIEEFWITKATTAVQTQRSVTFSHEVGSLHRWYEGRVHPVGGDRFTIIFQDVTDDRSTAARRQALLEFGDRLRGMRDPDQIAEAAASTATNALKVDGAFYVAIEHGEATGVLGDFWVTAQGRGRYAALPPSLQVSTPLAISGVSLQSPLMADPTSPSILSIPVTESGNAIAALGVVSTAVRVWSEAESRFVRDVAERASSAIARRRAESDLRALNGILEQEVVDRTQELMRSEEQLRQSQKMEAVGQLTGGIAHDFNNLLTGISGSLEIMQNRIGQGRLGDLDRYISSAQGAARRAASLTHRLLAFSRRQTLDPKPTDTGRLVCDMQDLIVRTAGPAVEMQMVVGGDIWPTFIDANQLENALLNLYINARDAMPDGGRLTVELENTQLDTRAAGAFDLPAGSYVALSVTDTGAGMPADVVDRAFEPFFTTKPMGVGTGLGLSMVYGFIRQSGGQAKIYSVPGTGTTVRLYLPRYLGELEEAPPMELSEMPRAEDGETVLVVDDEPSIRMLVTEVLEELGYHAIEAADGASGLKILESNVRIDLLVSDVGMPGHMNGRQMADQARMTRPDLKVLFITGYAEQAVIGNGDLAPGMHVMTKPFSVEGLAVRIKSLIDS